MYTRNNPQITKVHSGVHAWQTSITFSPLRPISQRISVQINYLDSFIDLDTLKKKKKKSRTKHERLVIGFRYRQQAFRNAFLVKFREPPSRWYRSGQQHWRRIYSHCFSEWSARFDSYPRYRFSLRVARKANEYARLTVPCWSYETRRPRLVNRRERRRGRAKAGHRKARGRRSSRREEEKKPL